MLVHFPAALLPIDLVFNVMSEYLTFKPLNEAAYYCLTAGVLGGWLAMAAGLFDFIRFIKPGSPAIKRVMLHLAIQVAVIICFSLLLALEYKHPDWMNSPTVLILCSKAILLLAMFCGNYVGGEIVFRYIAKEFQ